MKDKIVERLLELEQISIRNADVIINNGERKVLIIEELKDGGFITIHETIVLLKEKNEFVLPFGTPNDTQYPPVIRKYTDWTYDPHRPGQPRWEVTCSNNLNDGGGDE